MLTKDDLKAISELIKAETDLIRGDMATKNDLLGMAKKSDLEDMATTRDLLAMATKNDIKDMATKKDLELMATKYDFENMATKKDLELMARKSDLVDMATKSDIKEMVTKRDLSANIGILGQILKIELAVTKKEIADVMKLGFQGTAKAIKELKESHGERLDELEKRVGKIEKNHLS